MKNNVMIKYLMRKFNIILSIVLFTVIFVFSINDKTFTKLISVKDIVDEKNAEIVNQIFDNEIFKKEITKQSEVINDFNGSKVFIEFYSNEPSKKVISPNDMLDSEDIDIDKIFYPTEYNSFDYANIADQKRNLIEEARKLGCNTLLTKMKDFFYHPYTECEYDNYSLEELKSIQKELEQLYSSQKEIDKAGPCGFICDSLIANIKSVRKAIKDFNNEKHDKLSKLSQYILKDSVLGRNFTIKKNVVNTFFPMYESNYKRTPINSLSITDFKDNEELYYDANLKFRDAVCLPNDVGTKINVNDYLVVQTKATNDDSSNAEVDKNNFVIFKCSKQHLYSDNFDEYDSDEFKKAYDGKKSSDLELIWSKGLNEDIRYNDEWEQVSDILSGFAILYNPNYNNPEYSFYDLEFGAHEPGGGSISVEYYAPVRVKKNARVFGCYFYDFIDKYFSDDHDSEFVKNNNKEVYIKDLINKNIYFNYDYGGMFFIPYVTNEKDSSNKTIIDNIKVLTYDDKGYVTGIYKGEN